MARKVYQINEFPNSRYKFDIIDNARDGKNCVDTWKTIFEREKSKGAVGIINLGYFGLSGGGYASGCKIHGTWMCQQQYTAYGICIDEEGNAFLGTGNESNAYSYAEAVPAYLINDVEYNRDQTWTRNGTTTLGFKGDTLVCMLCDKDNGQSTAEQIEAMEDYGCQTILRMDGSWSSHGVLGFGHVCQPSQMRKDRNYLIIYDKEYEAPMSDKKLFLDPYGNGSEEETFAICDEIKYYLEKYEGVEVMLSRYRANPELDQSLRADQSDQWGADLIYCINVNASSENSDGLTACWTNKTTSTAYLFAQQIAEKMKEIGMNVSTTPVVLPDDPMLAESKACAALALCVGDYSTEANRYPMVVVSVKAICEQLGITYNPLPEPAEPGEPEEVPTYEDDPFNEYSDEERDTFQDLKKLGIIDSKAKMGEVVRYGDLATILSRAVDNIAEEDEDEETDIEDPIEDNPTIDTPNEPTLTIDEEYLKNLITGILTANGLTKEAMATQISNAVTEYMASYGLNKKIVEMTKTCFEVVIKALDQVDTDSISNPS